MTFGRIVIAAALLVSARAQSDCRTPSGSGGNCVSINQCEPLRNILNSRPTPQQTDNLRKSLCGYIGNTPKVCCPVQQAVQENSCFTPDGVKGSCIDVYKCPSILQQLQSKPVPQEVLDFLRRSRCQGPAAYSVCCGPSKPTPVPLPVPVPVPSGDSNCAPTATLPDPTGGCCGIESSDGNRIIGGTETGIDQYPWMALIEYRQNSKIKTLCGGALISGKYVLTAGHCVAGDVLRVGTPVSVRLGEYDTVTATDCVPADGGGEDCSEPPVSIPIERTIAHPQYDPYAPLRRDDIALIRLRTLAPYTDFIRPICLPTTDVTPSPPDDFKLYAAGWGATNTTTSSSNKKLHVELPLQTLVDCQKQYSVPRRNIPLWSKQLCAGGVKDKDTCKGDSGGPLVYHTKTIFYALGVVSFGTVPCGMENVPGVYSKVFEYNDWIRSEIRP